MLTHGGKRESDEAIRRGGMLRFAEERKGEERERSLWKTTRRRIIEHLPASSRYRLTPGEKKRGGKEIETASARAR